MVGLALGWLSAAHAATPLSSSALLLDERRLVDCQRIVERAAQHGGGGVQVVVNLHARLTSDLRIIEYGLLRDRRDDWTDPRNFRPMDETLRIDFRTHLARAFAKANALGVDLAVLPHLDAAGPVQEWRNNFDFDPYASHRGYTYAGVMIGPILEALNQSVSPERSVWLSLSGEMGRSLFTYPDAYRRLTAEARVKRSRGLLIGVGLNHSEIGGGEGQHRELSPDGRRQRQAFFEGCDFIGFSCYRPFSPPATAATFRSACDAFKQELAAKGLSFPARAKLHLTEVGLGGGRPGEPIERVAARPWEGVSRGPENPWQSNDRVRIRRDFYAGLLAYLASGEDSANLPEAAFLWSEGSWEPLGVDNELFADPVIADEVRRHNAAATGKSPGG